MKSSDDIAELKRRQELGQFLRARRETAQPQSHGVVLRRRRRAPGLLREEVADIAGVSVTWYTWLEQARPMNPSARVLDGLAHALQLDAAERTHLYRLARPDFDPTAAGAGGERLNPALSAILHGLAPHPVYAINARWDLLAWNEPAALVFGGFAQVDPERNILRRLLLDPGWRRLFANWQAIVESAVAQFRATSVHLSGNPRFTEFVSALCASSSLFETLWRRQQVERPPARQKVLNHPQAGVLTFEYATFRPDDSDDEVRFTIYTPANEACALALHELLRKSSASQGQLSAAAVRSR